MRKARIATLGTLLSFCLPGLAQTSAPVQGQENGPTTDSTPAWTHGELARLPDVDSLMDQHVESLVAGRPTCSALRLTPEGVPDVILYMYLGAGCQESLQSLRGIAESFSFGAEDGASASKLASASEPTDLPDWRTVFLAQEPIVEGQALATYYDPQLDLAITFRPARMNLSCRMSWPVYFNGYNHTGESRYWYVSADAVTAAAQAWRDRNTNPQLYLHRWTGSSYALVSSSSFGREMDFVGGYSPSCSASTYRVRVYMSNEGYYNALIVTFNAG